MSYKIITIARQFGSGGHEVGERLSKRLRIPLYDRSLVEMAARELELSPISVEKVDESALHSFLRTYHVPEEPKAAARYGLPLTDNTYLVQTALIKKLASQGPCIIVGRCGNHILRDHPGLIDVFLCASKKDRIARIMKRYEIPEKDAASAEWGSIEEHQLLMNVSILGMEKVVDILAGMYEG